MSKNHCKFCCDFEVYHDGYTSIGSKPPKLIFWFTNFLKDEWNQISSCLCKAIKTMIVTLNKAAFKKLVSSQLSIFFNVMYHVLLRYKLFTCFFSSKNSKSFHQVSSNYNVLTPRFGFNLKWECCISLCRTIIFYL